MSAAETANVGHNSVAKSRLMPAFSDEAKIEMEPLTCSQDILINTDTVHYSDNRKLGAQYRKIALKKATLMSYNGNSPNLQAAWGK